MASYSTMLIALDFASERRYAQLVADDRLLSVVNLWNDTDSDLVVSWDGISDSDRAPIPAGTKLRFDLLPGVETRSLYLRGEPAPPTGGSVKADVVTA